MEGGVTPPPQCYNEIKCPVLKELIEQSLLVVAPRAYLGRLSLIAARCERAPTYCEGCARKVDDRSLEYENAAGFQDSG